MLELSQAWYVGVAIFIGIVLLLRLRRWCIVRQMRENARVRASPLPHTRATAERTPQNDPTVPVPPCAPPSQVREQAVAVNYVYPNAMPVAQFAVPPGGPPPVRGAVDFLPRVVHARLLTPRGPRRVQAEPVGYPGVYVNEAVPVAVVVGAAPPDLQGYTGPPFPDLLARLRAATTHDDIQLCLQDLIECVRAGGDVYVALHCGNE